MATTEIEQLRALTDGAEGIEDAVLTEIITAEGSVKAAAVTVWRQKAASYASLVDISESGSSRSLSNLHKQALTMADTIARDLVVDVEEAATRKTTRRAVRR